MRIESHSFTDQGGREENQDALGIRQTDEKGLFVVADGLGGHQYGRRAADCAVEALLGVWEQEELPEKETLRLQIESANETILEIQQEEACVLKSTVAVLAVGDGRAVWANTGDSRVYYLHHDAVASITEDHSVAYRKYKAGEISREEIAEDEDQSRLLRTLGSDRRWEPALYEAGDLQAGDAFLLCSDGFWEKVTDDEILIDYLKADSAEEWAELMLLRAAERARTNDDNLSLITVILHE